MDLILFAMSSTYSSAGYLEVSIILGLICWIFHSRIRAMVDVLSNFSLRDHTTALEGDQVKQSYSVLHQHLSNAQLRKREDLNRSKVEVISQYRNALAYLKDSDWNCLPAERRPLMGATCQACIPGSQAPQHEGESYPIVDLLRTHKYGRKKSWFARIFSEITQCYYLRQFEYPYVFNSVLEDAAVKDAVQTSASEYGATSFDPKAQDPILRKQERKAIEILTSMRSTLSDFILRMTSWIFYKALPLLFHSMSIPQAQLTMLKKASDKGLPMIFLPLHRSHLDYIAVTFTLCNSDIKSPLVAAGENLRIPVFGSILRGLGAFFIKRKIDPVKGERDVLYRSVLHTYMTHCISAGHFFEFFIEGGRTRTGKPCMPKGGLLSVFVDAYQNGAMQDAMIVPVSVNYERLVEGSFVNEQMGNPKKTETFTSAITGIFNALCRNYGHVRVDFSEPFSLDELVKALQSKARRLPGALHESSSSTSLYGTDIVAKDQRELVSCIARHVLYDCSRSTAVMSTNAVAFLLLNGYRDGASLEDLTIALDKLRGELNCSKKDTGFSGKSVHVIEHAVEMLGPGLVKTEQRGDGVFITPVTSLPGVIELAYYNNSLVPHFALESIICTSLLRLVQDSYTNSVCCDKVLDDSLDLCEVLQYEFIFTKPCQNLNDSIFEVVSRLEAREILQQISELPEYEGRMPKALDILDDDDEDSRFRVKSVSPNFQVNKSNERLKFYANILRPFIDTYSVTVSCLSSLTRSQEGCPEEEFIKEVLTKIRAQLDSGLLPCGESVSVDTIKGCLKLLEHWSVIKFTFSSGVKSIELCPNVRSPDSIDLIAERVQRFQLSTV